MGNPIRADVSLSDSDNGRSITVHLCTIISVRLDDSGGIRSSDEAVLAVLPLPLPAPPPHGAYTWFQAKSTGVADLTSEPRWTVRVTVLT